LRSGTVEGSIGMAADAISVPWVVIPTYNEAPNIGRLVKALLSALDPPGHEATGILVVDDASPDGTGAVAERLGATHASVHVLHGRSRAGLASAYLAGFRYVLDRGAAHVIQMDGDLSHDPSAVPVLLAAAGRADLILGSRYVVGGETPGWSRLRRSLSRSGCAYARTLLGLGVRDLTGGFKCWRADILERVMSHPIRSDGYTFQVEMTYLAAREGATILEVPIVFRRRDRGESKMSAAVVGEAVLRVPEMRLRARS
jgi:dolichol-phosphate mannosyltransferase